MAFSRGTPEGIRITKVGAWFIAIALVVGVAAANTGNNALYLVEALLLATLVLSGIASRHNMRRLDVEVEAPLEVHAKTPFAVRFRLCNRDRWFARRLVVLGLGRGPEALVAHIGRGGVAEGAVELLAQRRGRLILPWAHVHSLWPLGLFRKGARIGVDLEVLVFPEIFPAAKGAARQAGRTGDRPSGRRGLGHELLGLRPFRPGDDRRAIHWKQSARTGDLILTERESESGRRLSIVLDNAVGDLADRRDSARFEHLVSEAATAADHSLGRGFEVELVTREGRVSYGRGRRHRLRILRALALLEARPRTDEPLLAPGDRVPRLRLGMEGRVTA